MCLKRDHKSAHVRVFVIYHFLKGHLVVLVSSCHLYLMWMFIPMFSVLQTNKNMISLTCGMKETKPMNVVEGQKKERQTIRDY